MEEQKEHKRRVRYKGTHPRNYNEKYKELNPEKYQGTIEHVIQKGSTPAGMHIPILVEEILDFLKIEPGQNGLDATLGYGGHSSRMLACLQGKGHLCALDVDPIEMAKTKERLAAQGYGPAKYGPFDFILADLGVSSMQIDNPERGFSYKYDGPLDLRLNPEAGISAAERLRTVARDELEGMLIENSDEPYAKEISKAVTRALRKGKKIDTTFALRDLIAEALDFLPKNEKKEAIKKSCARTFQALRIDVNNEYEVLEAFMEKLPDALAPGGRAAILTFHSGEDRLVKKSMKGLYQIGIYSEYSKEVIRPSKEECIRNSRASSTKMRWAIKAE